MSVMQPMQPMQWMPYPFSPDFADARAGVGVGNTAPTAPPASATSTKRADLPYFHREGDQPELLELLDHRASDGRDDAGQTVRVNGMQTARAANCDSRLIRPLRATRADRVA
jgi:hypothetical protein